MAAVFLGISPTQPFVVCFDPHGHVALEAASASGRCGGCVVTGASLTTTQNAVEVHADCQCTDVPVIAASDEARLRPSAVALNLDAVAAPQVDFLCNAELIDDARPSIAIAEEPRAPPALALIRTVVLLV